MTVAFKTPYLDASSALVLNADYRPLSYYPLSLWSWQTTLKAVFLGKVDILSEYDQVVHSPSLEVRLPSVIALKKYVKPSTYPAFTRFNVFLRDQFACQYCGSHDELTFDHVVPRCEGGRTTWQNIATACSVCNVKKGRRSVMAAHMQLQRPPYKPTTHDLHNCGRAFPPNFLHQSWLDYLYWDSTLER